MLNWYLLSKKVILFPIKPLTFWFYFLSLRDSMSLCCPLTFFLKKRLQQNHNLSKIVVPSYKDFLNIINSMSAKHHVITFNTQTLIKYLPILSEIRNLLTCKFFLQFAWYSRISEGNRIILNLLVVRRFYSSCWFSETISMQDAIKDHSGFTWCLEKE